MKRILSLALTFMLFVSSVAYSQNANFVRIEKLYKGSGVIFSSENYLPISLDEDAKRFNPTVEEITKAEKMMLCNSIEVKYIGLTGIYKPDKLKQKLWEYNRQYIGYQMNGRDSIILIHLLNFANKKAQKEYFADWASSYLIGFGDFYERNVVTMVVNLTKKEVSMR